MSPPHGTGAGSCLCSSSWDPNQVKVRVWHLSRFALAAAVTVPAACQAPLLPLIREQMSGPEISLYEKSILGCGLLSGLDCEKKVLAKKN